MIVLVFAAVLAFIGLINYALARSILYPPFIFCLVWTAELGLLYSTGDLFFPVTLKSLWIYLVGAGAFSAGGLLCLLMKMPSVEAEPDPVSPAVIDLAIKGMLVLGVLLFPLYWHHILAIVGNSTDGFWKALRQATLANASAVGGGHLNPAVSMTPFYSIFAVVAVFEFWRSKRGLWRTVAMIVLALIYQIGSSARSGILMLMIGMFSCIWFRAPKVAIRWGIAGVLAFILLFGANQILMEKVGTRADASFAENMPQVLEGFYVYSVGSLVAFDDAVHNPESAAKSSPFQYFIRGLNKVGFDLEEPPPFLKFVPISPDVDANVFTLYFSYYINYGMPGVVIALAIFGFVTTYVFRKTSLSSPWAALLMGPALYCVIMSFFADSFMAEVGFWLKALAVAYALYDLLPRMVKSRRFASNTRALET